MKKERNYNYQKRAYKAELLQWDETNLVAVSAELHDLGYDSFEVERGTIMARGKQKNLLCIAAGNWLRFGQNDSFKVMRPNEKETYVPIQSDDDLRAENAALRMEVAMLREVLVNCAEQLNWTDSPATLKRVAIAVDATQATAEDYESEVKAKALEEAARKFDGSVGYNWIAADGYANAFEIASELTYMAAELRDMKVAT